MFNTPIISEIICISQDCGSIQCLSSICLTKIPLYLRNELCLNEKGHAFSLLLLIKSQKCRHFEMILYHLKDNCEQIYKQTNQNLRGLDQIIARSRNPELEMTRGRR